MEKKRKKHRGPNPVRTGQSMLVSSIGVVESVFTDKFGTPRQPGLVPAAKSFLRLKREVQPESSLEGLAGFSHLWIVFWFHLNSNKKYSAKVFPPKAGGKKVGIFATRTPHRPNPIGLSVVKIISVEQNGVWVEGADIVDGSPILDIKPYLPYADRVARAEAGWSGEIDRKKASVKFGSRASLEVRKGMNPKEAREFRRLVRQVVAQDPRPIVYISQQKKEEHVVRLGKWDVFFVASGANQFLIQRIAFGG